MEFVPKEKATTIRQPSTANLMIDSADRDAAVYPLPNDFTIQRQNSILNGFFTRIGTTEVVLEWFAPNINATNNTFSIIYGGVPVFAQGALIPGFYNQAEALEALAAALTIITTPVTWSVVTSTPAVPGNGSTAFLVPSAPILVDLTGPLITFLDLQRAAPIATPVDNTGNPIIAPVADLRPFRYIDFVSSQMTYNQALKDSSTAQIVRDVLARWYFAFDNPPALDQYNFPILMGYSPFCLRRTFSPPKQIRWETNMPLGNLSFQLYGPNGDLILLPAISRTNWLMTLQVSEV